jgi:transposase
MNTDSTDWLEARRLRAWELKQEGWSQRKIAEALGVSEGAVSQWMEAARDGGPDSLKRKQRLGPAPKLSAEPLARLPHVLEQGAESFGFRGQVWTRVRVAAVIRREFGVSLSPRYTGRILDKIAWTPQKPIRRARQRDEQAIEQWRTEKWPALKKGPSTTGRASGSSMSRASIRCPQ